MPLTITQATAVNNLVRYLAPRPDDAPVTEAQAKSSLMILADAAHKPLMAGATSSTVAENWLPTVEIGDDLLRWAGVIDDDGRRVRPVESAENFAELIQHTSIPQACAEVGEHAVTP